MYLIIATFATQRRVRWSNLAIKKGIWIVKQVLRRKDPCLGWLFLDWYFGFGFQCGSNRGKEKVRMIYRLLWSLEWGHVALYWKIACIPARYWGLPCWTGQGEIRQKRNDFNTSLDFLPQKISVITTIYCSILQFIHNVYKYNDLIF